MWKYTVTVRGMMCGMCEAHVNDAVRKACAVKKVSSSCSKGQTVVIAGQELEESALSAAIRAAGYDVQAIAKEPYRKKWPFG